MAILRIDPWRELAGVQGRMNQLFGELYGRRGDDDMLSRGEWMPPVDIYQNGNQELVLTVEVPGLSREDIDVRVEDNTLTIRGERRRNTEVKDEQYHRVERSYGSFTRSFALPNTVAGDKVSADYRDGGLTVKLPIREEAKPRKIQVQVS
jgi:HSP20 family protein